MKMFGTLKGLHFRKMETGKAIVWLCVINGIAWIWCSYILAWTGHEQIAEHLSSTAVTEIIGVVLSYCAKSVLENISKNNAWPDKPSVNMITEEVEGID